MTATTAQSRQALATANDRRQARARLRADVREGRVSLLDLLADPPPVMHDVTLADAALWPSSRQRRSTAAVERLGRLALSEGVNLWMPVGRASMRSRRFVGLHAGWHGRARGATGHMTAKYDSQAEAS